MMVTGRIKIPAFTLRAGWAGWIRPESIRLDELGVVIHGQSYSRKATTDNLVAGYPQHDTDYFNIGLLYKEESYRIRGAVFEVYREMGCGFLEAVYQECLERECRAQGIPFIAQPKLKLMYKNQVLSQIYKPDLVCFDAIIVELKAVKELAAEHRAQVHNYLQATGLRLGFLVNFGHYPKATIERIVK